MQTICLGSEPDTGVMSDPDVCVCLAAFIISGAPADEKALLCASAACPVVVPRAHKGLMTLGAQSLHLSPLCESRVQEEDVNLLLL